MAEKVVLFVAGTDTGVGKTLVSVALVRRLRDMGLCALGMKPIETGCTHGADHDLVGEDGRLLALASGPSVPPLVVAPYRLGPPVAPAVAAERAGLELSLSDLGAAVDTALGYGDVLVIEGAGGMLSPMTVDGEALDLAARVQATVLIVGRDRLGVQSHVLLGLEACRRRAINIGGVLLSRQLGDENDDQENRRMILERGGAPVFPTLLPAFGDTDARIAFACRHLETCQIAESLLHAARRP